MKSILILHKIRVENANAIVGLTYGFPAIASFLGFTHALSRKLQENNHKLILGGCAIISHQQQIHAYRPNRWQDAAFCLTRNPLTKEGQSAPFVEEGRMHLTVSLVLECHFDKYDFLEGLAEFTKFVLQQAICQRLAGGTIIDIQSVDWHELPEDAEKFSQFTRKQMHKLLPGFVVIERSELLSEHIKQLQEQNSKAEPINAWLDFIALKSQATAIAAEENETTITDWEYMAKPAPGWLVPIAAGYHAISELYQPGEVARTRDPNMPFRFVESAYTIGEWLSPHRIKDLRQIIWRYHAHPEAGWYLCKNNYFLLENDRQLNSDFCRFCEGITELNFNHQGVEV